MKKPFLYLVPLAIMLGASLAACDSKSPTEPSPGPCTFAVTPSSLSFGGSGGSNSVNVSTASHCTWSATSNRSWMTITGGATGTGNGTVVVSVAANSGEASRSGTLTIGGQSVSVQEEGLGACTVAISPSSASYGKDAATGTFGVSAADHCTWTAASTATWLSVTSGSPGTANGTVGYALERNRDVNERVGTITVGGQSFTVNQAGDPPAVECQYSVTPVTFDVCMSAPFDLAAMITTQPGCTWTASPGASWINVTGGQSGSGSGVVTFRLSDNWDPPRHSVVQVRWPTPTAGQNLQISQAGCYYAVSTNALTFAAAGGAGQFNVVQTSDPISCGGATQNACRWSAASDVSWITVTTSMPQIGDNPVSFTVTANPTTSARVGRITVRDKVVTITQSGM